MKVIPVVVLLTALMVMPAHAQQPLPCDGDDQYTTVGVVYVDDHFDNPSSQAENGFAAPYVYVEANSIAGLQRDPPPRHQFADPNTTTSSDGSGHCGFDGEPDQWLV